MSSALTSLFPAKKNGEQQNKMAKIHKLITLRVTPEQLERIDFFAKEQCRSRNNYVVKATLIKLANDEHLETLKIKE